MSEVHRQLLEMPLRRESITPELLRFFAAQPDELMRFVRSFAGCVELKVPDPKMIKDLERDVEIARLISPSMANDDRVGVCRGFRVTHRHLEEICRAVHGREMVAPAGGVTLPKRIAEGGRLLRTYPGTEKIVCEMFKLTPGQARQGARAT